MSIFSIDDVTSNDEAAIASSIQQVVNASAPQVNSMTQASKLANKFAWTHPLKSNPSLVISQHQEYRQPASGETRNLSRTILEHLITHTPAGGSAANASNTASGPNGVAIGEVRLHKKVFAKIIQVFKSCQCFPRNQL